jgi:hypothetical protein
VISIVVDALGMVPYSVLTKIITLNDTLGSLIGTLLLSSVFGVIKNQLGLFWVDLMEEEEIGRSIAGSLGAWLVTIGSLVGLLGGIFTSLPETTMGWIGALVILFASLLL